MAKVFAYGPNGTPVGGLASVTKGFAPLNFDADFSVVEQDSSKVIYTDVSAPIDQPSTLRIAQAMRPNVYAGTSIESAAMLPSRKGVDLVVEIKEQWVETDDSDPTYYRVLPVRAALTFNLPLAAQVTPDRMEHLVDRVLAALYAQGDGDMSAGLNALLHGVIEKG